MTAVPTSGIVLEWARKYRGLSEDEAAERLGISVADLRAYEEGKHPTVTLFEAMASKYRLPQATLFLKTPPKTPPELVDFRTIGGRVTKDHSFDYRVALSNVRTLVHFAKRIASEDEDFVAPRLPRIQLSDDAEAQGERERRRTGVSVDEQIGWKAHEVFNRWRAHLEKLGVLVFQQKFPIEDGRGFSMYEHATVPVVVVNKEESGTTAKSFTIWHEYCHLLLREPGVSDLGDNELESYCNRFAAAFLMPDEALRRLLPIWPNEPVDWDDRDIERWARALKVSRRALAIRLEQKNFAPRGFSRRFAWTAHGKRAGGAGGNYIATRLSELGGEYVRRCLEAYERRAIDRVSLAEAIGLDVGRIDDVRQYVKRARELVGAA